MATSKVKTTIFAGRTIFLIFAAAILLASLLYTVLTLQTRENISSKRSQAASTAICPEVTFIVGSTPPQCGANCAHKPSNYCLSAPTGGCTVCDVASGCRPPQCGEPCTTSSQCPVGCNSCNGPLGSKTCQPGTLTPTPARRTPTPTPGSTACDKNNPGSRWATDLGLITSGGRVRFAKGWPYFDPSGKTFLVNIPSGKSVAFIACYDCDHWGSGSGGWKINWTGGSFVAKTPDNKWDIRYTKSDGTTGSTQKYTKDTTNRDSWTNDIIGPKTVKFDGNGDSAGGNVCIK